MALNKEEIYSRNADVKGTADGVFEDAPDLAKAIGRVKMQLRKELEKMPGGCSEADLEVAVGILIKRTKETFKKD